MKASEPSRRLTVDVVVPTQNRAALLARLCESMLRAFMPESLLVRVIVVDNASTDGTANTVRSFGSRFTARFGSPPIYLYEDRPGKSFALNRGIRAATGDLVAMLDDDEEIGEHWFEEIIAAFVQPDVDYLTGPCLPRWESPPPAWLINPHDPVLGLFYAGARVRKMPDDYRGQMMGGNAVVRRALLIKVGGYDVSLGPSQNRRQLSCEDSEMHERLGREGAHGEYRPDFVIHHFVPEIRLTKRYHRRWHLWHGVSIAILERRTPPAAAHILGIPRYLIGDAVRDLRPLVLGRSRSTDATANPSGVRFAAVLRYASLMGYCYGRLRYARAHRRSTLGPTTPGGLRTGSIGHSERTSDLRQGFDTGTPRERRHSEV